MFSLSISSFLLLGFLYWYKNSVMLIGKYVVLILSHIILISLSLLCVYVVHRLVVLSEKIDIVDYVSLILFLIVFFYLVYYLLLTVENTLFKNNAKEENTYNLFLYIPELLASIFIFLYFIATKDASIIHEALCSDNNNSGISSTETTNNNLNISSISFLSHLENDSFFSGVYELFMVIDSNDIQPSYRYDTPLVVEEFHNSLGINHSSIKSLFSMTPDQLNTEIKKEMSSMVVMNDNYSQVRLREEYSNLINFVESNPINRLEIELLSEGFEERGVRSKNWLIKNHIYRICKHLYSSFESRNDTVLDPALLLETLFSEAMLIPNIYQITFNTDVLENDYESSTARSRGYISEASSEVLSSRESTPGVNSTTPVRRVRPRLLGSTRSPVVRPQRLSNIFPSITEK